MRIEEFVIIEKSESSRKKPEAKNRLTNISVVEITLTGSPAVPKGTFQVFKSSEFDDQQVVIKNIVFKAIDKIKKQAFGYCLGPDDADYQGDVVTKEDVEIACHSFMRNLAHKAAKGTAAGLEHSAFTGVGYPIESAIDIDGSIAKAHKAEPWPGGWWVGVQVTDDEIWKSIEDGTIKGFSIGGTGKREALTENNDNSIIKIFRKITDLIKQISKTKDAKTFLEAYRENQVEQDLWNIFHALRESIISILEDDAVENKAEAIAGTIDQFKNAMASFVTVIKTGAELSRANVDMLTSVTENIQSTIANLQALLDKVKNKDVNKNSSEGEDEMTEELKKALESLTGKIDAIGKKVDKLEKAEPTEMTDDEKTAAATELGKSVEDITKAAEEAKLTFETYVAAEKDKIEKAKAKDGKDEDSNGDVLKAITDLTGKIDGIMERVDKLEGKPKGRNGADVTVDKNGEGDQDGKETDISKSIEKTAFSFRIPA